MTLAAGCPYFVFKQQLMKTIKAVLLGYGFSGSTFFAPFLDLHPGFVLGGSWERSKHKIQQDYPYTTSYPTLESILADDSVDLVCVNTPIETHYGYARAVLSAGKHAIVEKAFTTTAAEAEDLQRVATQNRVQLFVFQNRRYDSDFVTTRKVVRSGRLGHIHEATISYDFYFPTIREGHTETAASGGEFNNRGSHAIDQAVYLFGLPEAVFGDFAAFRKDSPVEDYVEAILYYPDKRVRVKISDANVRQQDAYIIHGDKGSFFKPRSDRQEDELLAGAKPTAAHWCKEPDGAEGVLYERREGAVQAQTIPTESGNYYRYYEAVYQCLTVGAPNPVPGVDGVCNMAVMDAVRESVVKGKVIKLHR